MPVMPSGRFVAIMPERARFHAGRLGLRVTEKTPHHQLYPLVDILVEHGGGGGVKGYGFSGHTLADLKWIAQWPEGDRRFFLDWIREPAQVATIERARRRLLAESSPPKVRRFSYPDRLYSTLRRRVESLELRRAPAVQWRRTLNNLVHDGVRRDELVWSGVLDFLTAQPRGAVIEHDQVVAAIGLEGVRPQLGSELECDHGCTLPFREVAQRIPTYQLNLAGVPAGEEDIGVVRFDSADPPYRVGMLRRRPPAAAASPPRWFVLGPYGQPVVPEAAAALPFFPSAGAARAAANEHALRNHRLRCELTECTRYEHMSLHGGEGYREWLVTLPDYLRSHFNGHFHERNILVHIRSKLRTTTGGERVLFIEEIQSDWHRAAARHGVRGTIPMAPFRREWAALALKLMLLHVVETGLDGIAWADASVHELRYDQPMPPLRRLYDEEVPRLLRRLAQPWRGEVAYGAFETRHPWLHAARDAAYWKVEGGAGRFATRARYDKREAQRLIERHSRAVTLTLPMLLLPEGMHRHIIEHGLPLFGERHVGV